MTKKTVKIPGKPGLPEVLYVHQENCSDGEYFFSATEKLSDNVEEDNPIGMYELVKVGNLQRKIVDEFNEL